MKEREGRRRILWIILVVLIIFGLIAFTQKQILLGPIAKSKTSLVPPVTVQRGIIDNGDGTVKVTLSVTQSNAAQPKSVYLKEYPPTIPQESSFAFGDNIQSYRGYTKLTGNDIEVVILSSGSNDASFSYVAPSAPISSFSGNWYTADAEGVIQ